MFSAVAVGDEVKVVVVGPYAGEMLDLLMTAGQARQLAAQLSRVAAGREEVIREPDEGGIGYFMRVKGFTAPTVAALEEVLNGWLSEKGAVWVRDIRFLPGEREQVAWVIQEVDDEAGA